MTFKTIFLGALLLASTSTQAKMFTVRWDGGMFENGGTAVGHFNFSAAPASINGANETEGFPSANVQLLDLTVSGTLAGNGSFTEADFDGFSFQSYSQLDYSKELIGQTMENGYNFGSFDAGYAGPSGDFNLFAKYYGVPTGVFFFILNANGQALQVVSMAPSSVPEPASWALMIAGFGMTGFAMRRRTAAAAA